MADTDDIEERMKGADDFFEGEDQWYHIDEYVDEEDEAEAEAEGGEARAETEPEKE